MKQAIVKNFVNTLENIVQKSTNNFSGAGLVLYDNLQALSKYRCNLVNDGKDIPLFRLGSSELSSYLATICEYHHPYHDGFHFLNSEGFLTHVAQFFSPPIRQGEKNLLRQGARTFCAQMGSNMHGVLMVGSISSHRHIYLFQNGMIVNQQYNIEHECTAV